MNFSMDACLAPRDFQPGAEAGKIVVIVDVLRATSTWAAALAHGARAICPLATAEAVMKKADAYHPSEVLLCGERQAVKCPGFDLGNSPLEYHENVRGKTLLFSSTNGSAMLLQARQARRVYAAALVNASAVARALERDSGDVLILCAGTDGEYTLEDAVGAGALIYHLIALSGIDCSLSPPARQALDTYHLHASDLSKMMAESRHGRRLAEKGFINDLDYCSSLNRLAVCPRLQDDGLIING